MNSKIFPGLLPLLFSLSLRAQWSFDSSISVSGNPGLYSIVISSKGRMLIGIAIDKGFIPSADERILRYFPALGKDPDPRKRQVTIREIMNQASGKDRIPGMGPCYPGAAASLCYGLGIRGLPVRPVLLSFYVCRQGDHLWNGLGRAVPDPCAGGRYRRYRK
jgi:hypothetical protein